MPRTLNPGEGRLPTGTASFLFTDIEGSTRLVQEVGPLWTDLLDTHRRVLRAVWAEHNGVEVMTEGDAFFVAFANAADAVAAAAAGQRALAAESWPGDHAVRVRIGIHTGEARLVGRDYEGLDIHRAARVQSAAHGGQVLLSESTRVLVEGRLPPGVSLRDMGEQRLKDLLRPEHLYQLLIEGLPTDFPPIKTLSNTPNNLPLQLTSFVGREAELAEARRLLGGTRLLTLTGPGGTGKTRLSLQLAADVVEEFSGGVFFVPLATISDAELVPTSVAQAIGVNPGGSRPVLDVVVEHLKGRRVLLVLDNFEQILGAAPMISEILHGAPEARVVVSSRAPLRVYGEQEYPIPPLGLPDLAHLPGLETMSQYEAVRLFVERAVSVKPDFEVTNENAAAVAGICARLDGLPLAIELAAARVRLLPPQAMLSRLELGLKALGGGSRDLPQRQQTLFGAIAWSHDLLEPEVRRLMARFSVFVRGATLEAAESVCAPELDLDILDGLETLVEQSLLRQREESGEPRFWMLVTIQEFGRDKLAETGEAEVIRERHARFFLDLAETAGAEIMGRYQKDRLDQIEREHDNLRAALSWFTAQGEFEPALRMCGALWRFWQMRSHLIEGYQRVREVVEMASDADFPVARIRALEAAGGLSYWQGDMQSARGYYSEALALARNGDDRLAVAHALYNLGFSYGADRSDIPLSKQYLEEALDLFTEAGDQVNMAMMMWGLSNAAQAVGDLDLAESMIAESLTTLRGLDDQFAIGWTLRQSAAVALERGKLEQARQDLGEAASIFLGARDTSATTILLKDMAALADQQHRPRRAAILGGASEALSETFGTRLSDVAEVAQHRRVPGSDLPPQELASAWAVGAALDFDAAIAYALSDED